MPRSSTQSSTRSDGGAALAAAAAAPRLPVLVVTADDELWTPLAGLARGRDARQFDSVAELVDQWDGARAAVILVDGRGGERLDALVQSVLSHGDALVPVAIVDEAGRAVAAQLERKRLLFDHLTVPLDPGTAHTVIDRATEEAAARQTLAAGEPPASAGGPPATRRGPSPTLVAAIVAAVTLAAAGGWWLTRSSPTPAAAPTAAAPGVAGPAARPATPSAPAAAVPAEEIEARLERARAAMRDKHYVEPAADNALGHYKAVLDLEPQNGEARQGLDRIAELLITRAATAMAAHDYTAALRSLEAARSIKPDHPRLAALDAQVSQRQQDLSLTQVQAALAANAFARVAALLAQAEKSGAMSPAQVAQLRQEAARREAGAQIADLARLAQARISQGRLLEPAGDSAHAYLKQLQERGGAAVADDVARLTDAYGKRLASDARAAIGRGAGPELEPLLAELRTLPGGSVQVTALQKDADRAREQARSGDAQRLAQLVRDRTAAHRLLAPEDDSALHYYRALVAADPRQPALPALKDALGAALVDAARTAAAAGNGADAQAATDAARELGVAATTLAALTAVASPAKPTVAATPPRLVKDLSVVYPPRAATAGTEGWVDIEFDVPVNGTPANLKVVDSQPTGTFDAAALAAVRRARFAPAKAADGSPVAVQTRLRVRFALESHR